MLKEIKDYDKKSKENIREAFVLMRKQTAPEIEILSYFACKCIMQAHIHTIE